MNKNKHNIHKINILFSIISFFISTTIFGQNVSNTINPNNCREGEKVEYCQTHVKMQELLKDPIRLQEYLKYNAEQENLIYNLEHQKKGGGVEKGIIYKIPIVFHVLHNGGNENISDAQILDQLAILNRDFRKLNSDVNDVVSQFQGKQADVEIEFVLANRDPSGKIFTGITRTQNTITTDGSNGDLQANTVANENNVYKGDWPGNKYLNIFICSSVGTGVAGYTRKPYYDNSMQNGIWMMHNYVGSIGTSSINSSRVLTHEIGHWLNLSHPWGDNNDPGVACGDDGVSDTPKTKGFTSCNLTNSTVCDAAITENIENYMDYSYCNKMFTEGQKTKMRAALNSTLGGRNYIWSTTNLNKVAPLTSAIIASNKTIICPGEQINLKDYAFSQANSWSWTTTGGIPSSSTLQSPTITYNTPGYYTINLTSSLNSTSVKDTKTQYIQVVPSTNIIPYYENFQNYTKLFDKNSWSRYDQGGNRGFEIFEGAGFSDNKCIKLTNFDETTKSTIDELGSQVLDLSTIAISKTVTLSFKYSYRKKIATNSESLKISVSTDCGNTWQVRKTITSSNLSDQISTSPWQPVTESDWTTVHVTNILSQYYKSDFRFKFQFTANGGNNLYLDDINLYEGAPSDTIVLGINEVHNALNNLAIFPNPSEDELNVHFSVPSNNDVFIKIQDVVGKTEQSQTIKAIEGSNMVLLNTQSLSSGIYFLNIQIGNSSKTIQFIVK